MGKRSKRDVIAEQALLDEIRKNFADGLASDRHNFECGITDLKMLVGEGHWDSQVEAERREDGRPCLVINQLPTFTRQVIGDQRQSRPATQIIPSDNSSDQETADTIESKVREIKYASKADAAHDNAFAQAVRSGFGYWRIRTDYEDDESFDQTIIIDSIPNQFGVMFDPLSVKWDKTDAGWLIVYDRIGKERFKAKYPGVSPSDADVKVAGTEWFKENSVTVAEYFKQVPKPYTIYQMKSGGVVFSKAVLDALLDGGDTVVRSRAVDSYEIVRYLVCGTAILEDKQVWPSRYYPVVEVLGETVNVNGKVYKRSLIRDSHDSQRAYDFSRSSEVEMFALAPKAPVMVTPKQTQGHERQWRNAHKRTYPFLYVNPDPASPGWPARIEPPQMSTAITQSTIMSKQELRDTMGIFNASLGENSREISGIAIQRRQKESDTGTYIWMDNLQYALELEDRIILDLFPAIFDNVRRIRVRTKEGETKLVDINKPTFDEKGKPVIKNNIKDGKFDVMTILGPSYSTQRQEASDNMLKLVQAIPNVAPYIADKLVRSMDFHDAKDIADRLLKGVVPPNVLNEEELQQAPQPEQQGPDPVTMAQIELAGSQVKYNIAKAEKSLAEIQKIRDEIGQSQLETTTKIMQILEQRLGGGDQGGGQDLSQVPTIGTANASER